MSQSFGIEIKNSHLLRASFGLVALSLLVPGLFQFGPPQWLGSHGSVDGEHATHVAIVDIPSEERSPVQPEDVAGSRSDAYAK